MKKGYQQGDVILEIVDSIPEGAEAVEPTRNMNILAEGEVTGHAHRITAAKTDLFKLGDALFMRANEKATVTHEEHGHITVPKGTYKIGIVKEIDPFTKAIEKVKD